VVTSRSTDIGALISSTGGPGDVALFTVADQRKLRVYVRVPQNYSALVSKGLVADLTVPEYAGQTFKAVVVNSAQAVAAQSGAELVELQLDNGDGRIKSGDYAQVTFRLTSAANTTRIPVTAIQYRHNGPVVAVVGADNHVTIKPVIVARDLGSSVEIGSGIAASDRVIDNPPESLVAGDLVRVAGASAQKAGA
jgi:RND family efflux transporter MFP subunit